jgi:uncharacterized protein YjbI with pentapeptide repeats/FtsH-binding integral membrane protein
MVSITVVLLPFLTLLALQLQFLAYQSEAVTWCQRVALWLDIAVLAILWPIILHPGDDWRAYCHELLAAQVPRRRVWLALALLFAGFVLVLFGVAEEYVLAGLVLLLVSSLSVIPLRGWHSTPRTPKLYLACLVAAAILSVAVGLLGVFLAPEAKSLGFFLLGPLLLIPLAVLWHPQAPRGTLALLVTLLFGLLLPLALLVDGEGLEGLVVRVQQWPATLFTHRLEIFPPSSSTVFSGVFLQDKRRLYLNEQVLLAKPPKPETLALIRSGEWQEGLKQVEPLNLKGRNLRHARMEKVILIGADLRGARLQGADLAFARLQGADLSGAQLQGSNLWMDQLQGAKLFFAQLQGAELFGAQLQGADLRSAQLQGADLRSARLQGAVMEFAELPGAELGWAYLQGAKLFGARLQGANLYSAELQGAYLRGAQLQGAVMEFAELQGADLLGAKLYSFGVPRNTELIDARGVVWAPLDNKTLVELINLQTFIKDRFARKDFLDRVVKASRQGVTKMKVQSCLAEPNTPLVCATRYDPQKPEELADFIRQLQAYLGGLACESPEIALGLMRQIPGYSEVGGRYIAGGFGDLKQPLPSFMEYFESRQGLDKLLKERLADPSCAGLQGLNPEEKKKLQAIK